MKKNLNPDQCGPGIAGVLSLEDRGKKEKKEEKKKII